jgi:outer membrane scaffolding protein for murein synthesis (MipA/OmpV family)
MNRFVRIGSLLVFMTCCLGHASAIADEKPLWELGVGVFAVQLPAYRGAMESSNDILPIPYVVYRGEHIKADKDGVRGVLFDSDAIEINLSVAASPPVNSRKVRMRWDMPDLSSSLELGSSIDIKLWQSPDHDAEVKLFVPVRAAFTLESNPQSIGWQFTPRINLDIHNPLGLGDWTLGMVAGPIFGTREQHSYFYSVAPQYSTADRPTYEAKGGYAGVQLLSALWKRFPSYWVGGFVRYDNVRGAVFENSPLVTQKSGFAGGIAISWILGQSSEKVMVNQSDER